MQKTGRFATNNAIWLARTTGTSRKKNSRCLTSKRMWLVGKSGNNVFLQHTLAYASVCCLLINRNGGSTKSARAAGGFRWWRRFEAALALLLAIRRRWEQYGYQLSHV
jgi:hypothetical protein